MTTKKKVSTKSESQASTAREPLLYHRLDTLLHAVRSIAQHEDALCELTHAAKRSGKLSAEEHLGLRDVLDKLPSHDYLNDLDAVSDMVAEFRHKSSGKRVAAAKKAPGRKSSK